jgi:hypothetical protein
LYLKLRNLNGNDKQRKPFDFSNICQSLSTVNAIIIPLCLADIHFFSYQQKASQTSFQFTLVSTAFETIYICYLPAARSGWEKLRPRSWKRPSPDEKNCARGLENGPSPKGEGRFQDRGRSFSHPDRRCR